MKIKENTLLTLFDLMEDEHNSFDSELLSTKCLVWFVFQMHHYCVEYFGGGSMELTRSHIITQIN